MRLAHSREAEGELTIDQLCWSPCGHFLFAGGVHAQGHYVLQVIFVSDGVASSGEVIYFFTMPGVDATGVMRIAAVPVAF